MDSTRIFVIYVFLMSLLLVLTDKKSHGASYRVEGCFSDFAHMYSKDMKTHNSNLRCQDMCRERGFILAATNGSYCQCGNNYPTGKKVGDNQCSSKCRSWSPCHQLQSCCGGPKSYTMSVVGNIDVAKQILRRLSHEWQTRSGFRNYMELQLENDGIKSDQGTRCGRGRYITGVFVQEHSPFIVKIECRYAPAKEFDDENFELQQTCSNGHYMKAHDAFRIFCARPKGNDLHWQHCYNRGLSLGWNKCVHGYFRVSLRKCCKPADVDSWVKNPELSIKIKDTSGQLKHCYMKSMDKSPTSTSYRCTVVSDRKNVMILQASSFKIEDKTALNVAKPQPIQGFRPVTCMPHSNPYTCQKRFDTSLSISYGLNVGTGFTMTVSIGASLEIEAKFLGSGTKTTFQTEVSMSSSFNVERSTTKTKTTSESTIISVQVPRNTQIRVNLLRSVENIEYKWKAIFKVFYFLFT